MDLKRNGHHGFCRSNDQKKVKRTVMIGGIQGQIRLRPIGQAFGQWSQLSAEWLEKMNFQVFLNPEIRNVRDGVRVAKRKEANGENYTPLSPPHTLGSQIQTASFRSLRIWEVFGWDVYKTFLPMMSQF